MSLHVSSSVLKIGSSSVMDEELFYFMDFWSFSTVRMSGSIRLII